MIRLEESPTRNSPPARHVRGKARLDPGEGIFRTGRKGEEVVERTVLVVGQRLVRDHLDSQLLWGQAPLDDDRYHVGQIVELLLELWMAAFHVSD